MSHTPGPWIVEACCSDIPIDICLDYRIPGRESPIMIAAAMWDGEDDNPIGDLDRKTACANARLIASAPDLLAACEAIERRILDAGDGLPAKPRNTQDVLRRIDSIPINVFLLAAVVEALKKARGA